MLFNVAATCHMWFYMQQLVEQIKEHMEMDITRVYTLSENPLDD